MVFLYNLGIFIYTFLIRMVSFKSVKAKAWVDGRKNLLTRIAKEVDPTLHYTWFHFASLGEFEQGRPVMEKLKAEEPDRHLLITFFSPSGYEIRKNYALADHVFYLPTDTEKNAREFIRLINPKQAVFTKYEYWYHYFKELHHKEVPLYIISGIFRKSQPFFKWYGVLHRQMLQWVTHFFVQNEESKLLLGSLNIIKVTVSGDTRFDRVVQQAASPMTRPEIEEFCKSAKVFVAGSTWPEDEVLIAELVREYPNWKFILAPHEINEENVVRLEKLFQGRVIRYSEYQVSSTKPEAGKEDLEASEPATPNSQPPTPDSQYSILIINNIGMLSSLYYYADIAFIGGGFGKGIHNTLEAAAFGIPVLFGPNYDKFQEAKDLISNGGGFSVDNEIELKNKIQLLQDEVLLKKTGDAARHFVQNHTGATDSILKQIK